MKSLLSIAAILLWLAQSVAHAEAIAITGARILTMGPQGTLENATVLFEDGVILAIGRDLTVPDGTKLVHASGKIITPGIFSPMGQIGLVEVDAVPGTVDFVQRGDDFTAGFDILDAYNRRSTVIAVNRAEGITSTLIAPRAFSPDENGHSSRVFSGIASIVKLGDDSDFLDMHGAGVVVNLGEAGSAVAAGSRAAATLVLRTALRDALDYRDNKDAYERGSRRSYSLSRTDLESLVRLLDGEIPLLANANRASDIETMMTIASDYRIRLIIVGGAEAWMLADRIAAQQVSVILDATNNLPGNFDKLSARLESGALLSESGVLFTFGGGVTGAESLQTHNARNITQAAGIAVANGLSWDKALNAITRAPAEIFGVAERLGSIEAGKAADLVIWPDDPLELSSFPDAVFINGHSVSMINRQTLLRDRYIQTDSDLPPAFRNPSSSSSGSE